MVGTSVVVEMGWPDEVKVLVVEEVVVVVFAAANVVADATEVEVAPSTCVPVVVNAAAVVNAAVVDGIGVVTSAGQAPHLPPMYSFVPAATPVAHQGVPGESTSVHPLYSTPL